MSFLSSPHRASRNVSRVFPAILSCFDTSARELCKEGRGGRIQGLTLDSGWPAGCRLPRGCRHHFVSPSVALKATIDQCAERFTAAALDGPSKKLNAVNSQQNEAHRLVSWSHQWAPWLPCFNYSSRPSGNWPRWWEKERAGGQRKGDCNKTREDGYTLCQETGSHLFTVKLGRGLLENLIRESRIKWSSRPNSAN